MKLNEFQKMDFVGAPKWRWALWLMLGSYFVESRIFCCSCLKVFVLRLFGAQVGGRCVIKPRVRIKLPWKLKVGNDVWLGEGVWIDNIDHVEIGNDVCISQDAYLCTGNHDWSRVDFKLTAKPIQIENQVWIGARTSVGPGVIVKDGAVLTLGSVAVSNLDPMMIYTGNPAKPVTARKIIPSA